MVDGLIDPRKLRYAGLIYNVIIESQRKQGRGPNSRNRRGQHSSTTSADNRSSSTFLMVPLPGCPITAPNL